MAYTIAGILIPTAIGVVAFEALSDAHREALGAAALASRTATVIPTGGGLVGKVVTPAQTRSPLALTSSTKAVVPLVGASGPNVGSSQTKLTTQQAIREAEAKAKAKYAALGGEAKTKGAKALSDKLHITPPLKGTESWDEMAKAAGAAAGAAACSAIGIGITVAPLCSIAGAYFGEKLEDWLADEYGKVKSAAASTYQDVKAKVSDLAGDAYHEIASWF